MITDDTQAAADMAKMINDAWQAGTTAIVGSIPKLLFKGDDQHKDPVNVYWGYVEQQIFGQRQTAFRNDVTRKYATDGEITVRINAPRDTSQSFDKARKLAILARNAFRGKRSPHGIAFVRCRIQELASTAKEHRIQAVCGFWYHQAG